MTVKLQYTPTARFPWQLLRWYAEQNGWQPIPYTASSRPPRIIPEV